MKILIYSLITLATGLTLVVAGLSLILGWIFQSSSSNSDALWGWGIMLFGLTYSAHPYLIYWLWERGSVTAAILVSLFFIASSIGMIFILPTAIEASARP